jgi:hypothetical protein
LGAPPNPPSRIERSTERIKGRIQRVLPYAGRFLAGSILRFAVLP